MSTSSTKPTIVVVHGSWHVPAHFDPLTKLLRSAGYPVSLVRLPSVRNIGPFPTTTEGDSAAVQSVLLNELDAGNDVVVLMHSYGGVPGGAAIRGMLKSDRVEKGLKGGVVACVYISSFALDEGVSAFDIFMKVLGEEVVKANSNPMNLNRSDDGGCIPTNPKKLFYHDVSDAEAERAISLLQRQSEALMLIPQTYAPWKHVPTTYIICEEDQALPAVLQEEIVKQPGGQWRIERMKGVSHSPFLSRARDTADLVLKALERAVDGS